MRLWNNAGAKRRRGREGYAAPPAGRHEQPWCGVPENIQSYGLIHRRG